MRHIFLDATDTDTQDVSSKIFRSPDPKATPSAFRCYPYPTQWHHNTKSEAVPTKHLINNQSCTPPITTTLPCISKTRHHVIQTLSLPTLEGEVVLTKPFLVVVTGLEEIQRRSRDNFTRRCWNKVHFTSAQCCNITWQELHR